MYSDSIVEHKAFVIEFGIVSSQNGRYQIPSNYLHKYLNIYVILKLGHKYFILQWKAVQSKCTELPLLL